jgi:hypothetical protein
MIQSKTWVRVKKPEDAAAADPAPPTE